MSRSPTLSYVNTSGQDVIWWTKATSDQQHTDKALAIKPGIDTEIIRDLALAIAQVSDSRNRGADCFPGIAKHPLGAPSQHPKAAAIKTTMHVLTCPDRSQYSAQDIPDVYLQGRQEDCQELGSSTWPMSKQCTPCARATLKHLAAGLDWHWGHEAIRAHACERRQGSRAATASGTRSSWDMATSMVLFLSTMARATKVLWSCWQHHVRVIPVTSALKCKVCSLRHLATSGLQQVAAKPGKLPAPHPELHLGRLEQLRGPGCRKCLFAHMNSWDAQPFGK